MEVEEEPSRVKTLVNLVADEFYTESEVKVEKINELSIYEHTQIDIELLHNGMRLTSPYAFALSRQGHRLQVNKPFCAYIACIGVCRTLVIDKSREWHHDRNGGYTSWFKKTIRDMRHNPLYIDIQHYEWDLLSLDREPLSVSAAQKIIRRHHTQDKPEKILLLSDEPPSHNVPNRYGLTRDDWLTLKHVWPCARVRRNSSVYRGIEDDIMKYNQENAEEIEKAIARDCALFTGFVSALPNLRANAEVAVDEVNKAREASIVRHKEWFVRCDDMDPRFINLRTPNLKFSFMNRTIRAQIVSCSARGYILQQEKMCVERSVCEKGVCHETISFSCNGKRTWDEHTTLTSSTIVMRCGCCQETMYFRSLYTIPHIM